MKKIIVLVLFFISWSFLVISSETLLKQGNTLFLQGRFQEAVEKYESITSKNTTVWHNLGNCFFNEKKYVQALVCWNRAKMHASYRQLVALYASEKMVQKRLQLSQNSYVKTFLQVLVLGSSIKMLQLLLCFLLLGIILLWYRAMRLKKSLYDYKKVLFMLFGVAILLGYALLAKQQMIQQKNGIINVQLATVFVGPETTFAQKGTLPYGCLVHIVAIAESMCKITSSYGSGWVVCSHIEVV